MEKEVQFRGVWGILKESIKLLIHNARLLLSLAAILVLPLCFVILGHPLVTNPLLAQIASNLQLLAAESTEHSSDAGKTEREVSAGLGWLGLVLLLYFVIVLAFSLASTAAIVYSVACIYLEKTVALSKILAIVPRVWKRLMVTFLWMFLVSVACQGIFVVSLGVVVLLAAGMGASLVPLIVVLAVAFLATQVYISVVWYLAYVISVLEERYGIDALKESARIVKGKKLVAVRLMSIHALCAGVIGGIFQAQVVTPQGGALPSRILLGLLLLLALTLVHLIGMIMHGLFYFLVKSYHKESIHRMVLSDHLDAYLGEYVALKDPEALYL